MYFLRNHFHSLRDPKADDALRQIVEVKGRAEKSVNLNVTFPRGWLSVFILLLLFDSDEPKRPNQFDKHGERAGGNLITMPQT